MEPQLERRLGPQARALRRDREREREWTSSSDPGVGRLQVHDSALTTRNPRIRPRRRPLRSRSPPTHRSRAARPGPRRARISRKLDDPFQGTSPSPCWTVLHPNVSAITETPGALAAHQLIGNVYHHNLSPRDRHDDLDAAPVVRAQRLPEHAPRRSRTGRDATAARQRVDVGLRPLRERQLGRGLHDGSVNAPQMSAAMRALLQSSDIWPPLKSS